MCPQHFFLDTPRNPRFFYTPPSLVRTTRIAPFATSYRDPRQIGQAQDGTPRDRHHNERAEVNGICSRVKRPPTRGFSKVPRDEARHGAKRRSRVRCRHFASPLRYGATILFFPVASLISPSPAKKHARVTAGNEACSKERQRRAVRYDPPPLRPFEIEHR